MCESHRVTLSLQTVQTYSGGQTPWPSQSSFCAWLGCFLVSGVCVQSQTSLLCGCKKSCHTRTCSSATWVFLSVFCLFVLLTLSLREVSLRSTGHLTFEAATQHCAMWGPQSPRVGTCVAPSFVLPRRLQRASLCLSLCRLPLSVPSCPGVARRGAHCLWTDCIRALSLNSLSPGTSSWSSQCWPLWRPAPGCLRACGRAPRAGPSLRVGTL